MNILLHQDKLKKKKFPRVNSKYSAILWQSAILNYVNKTFLKGSDY